MTDEELIAAVTATWILNGRDANGFACYSRKIYEAIRTAANVGIYDPVCSKCGDPLTTEELICERCRE